MSQSARTELMLWDPFVRAAHWLVVLGFAVAYLTEDDLLPIHVWAGYVVGGLVVARVLWGFVGPPRARFSDFVYPPPIVVSYLFDLLRFRAARYLGHSPTGGAMVILLLLSLAGTVGTGLAVYGAEENAGPLSGLYAAAPAGLLAARADGREKERGARTERSGREAKALEEIHEFAANLTLLLIAFHVVGVLWASAAHRENLVKAMITGRKRLGFPGENVVGATGTPPGEAPHHG